MEALTTMEAPINKVSATVAGGSGAAAAASTATAAARPEELMPAPLSNKKNKERLVTQFAVLLGRKSQAAGLKDPAAGGGAARSGSSANDLVDLISESVASHDIVLKVPSLEMKVTEKDKSGQASPSPLPKVGEHRQNVLSGAGGSTSTENSSSAGAGAGTGTAEEQRPTMAASVLTSATNGAATVEQKAAQEMSKQTSWTKSTIRYAAGTVASNVSDFFGSLVDSRVRAWTLLLLRHSLSKGDSESRSRLLSMLAASIKVNSVETDFKTLPLPESAEGQPREAEVILPLLFTARLNVSLQDRKETVTGRAPGTISAHFDKESQKITLVEIRLDTGVMLSSMVDQARLVVSQAVARATKTNVPTGSALSAAGAAKSSSSAVGAPNPAENTIKESSFASMNHHQAASTTSSLKGFRSALSLNPSALQQSPRLQKARTSALKLNGVLHGKAEGKSSSPQPIGLRKVRSVKWDTPLQLPKLNASLAPSPKKQRCIPQSFAKLKSYKSFGRPHAGDFGSGPRNATFGEYGGRTQHWDRHGRLANHPVPMQSQKPSLLGPEPVKPGTNEPFDLNKVLSMRRNAATRSSSASIPRTTTALEMFLVKSSTGRAPA